MVTRKDLAPGLQAAQALHAALDFALSHPEIACNWREVSNRIVLLSSENEDSLKHFKSRLEQKGIVHTAFYEPDLDHAMTSIALEPSPEAQKACSNLSLMGRAPLHTSDVLVAPKAYPMGTVNSYASIFPEKRRIMTVEFLAAHIAIKGAASNAMKKQIKKAMRGVNLPRPASMHYYHVARHLQREAGHYHDPHPRIFPQLPRLRELHLVHGYLKGIPYSEMERKCRKEPYWKDFRELVYSYGPYALYKKVTLRRGPMGRTIGIEALELQMEELYRLETWLEDAKAHIGWCQNVEG